MKMKLMLLLVVGMFIGLACGPDMPDKNRVQVMDADLSADWVFETKDGTADNTTSRIKIYQEVGFLRVVDANGKMNLKERRDALRFLEREGYDLEGVTYDPTPDNKKKTLEFLIYPAEEEETKQDGSLPVIPFMLDTAD